MDKIFHKFHISVLYPTTGILQTSSLLSAFFFFWYDQLPFLSICCWAGRLASSYIHNWPLQHFSQNYGLAFHATHAVCFNFIHKWRSLQFKFFGIARFLKKLFYGKFIYSQEFLPEICWDRAAHEIFFHIFVLMPDLGYELGLYI